MVSANVIGEGTYGCVHKPSLKCEERELNGKVIDYSNRVSKILVKEEAINEMMEYVLIKNIDKNNEYYLGEPINCTVKEDDYNIQSIRKCKNGKKIVDELSSNYSLIIMKDGGINLLEYYKIVKKLLKTPENQEKMEKFWIEAHRMIKGIKAFLDNGFIHHDMKPQNIVYNEKDNRLNFIDFGLVQNKQDIIEQANKSDYHFSIHHWSYPPEMFYLDKTNYDDISQLSKEERLELYKTLLNKIDNPDDTDSPDDTDNPDDTDHGLALATQGIMKYIQLTETDYFFDLKILFEDQFIKNGYSSFVKKCIDTIDIYGLGFSFMGLLENCKYLIRDPLMSDFEDLFFKMITPNYNKRIDIDSLLDEYENILEKHGLLVKYGYKFINHNLQKIDNSQNTLSRDILEEINLIVESPLVKSAKIDKMISTELTPCPDGKIMNSSRICVKDQIKNVKQSKFVLKYKSDKIRDDIFRRVSVKKQRKSKSKKQSKSKSKSKNKSKKHSRLNVWMKANPKK